MTAEKEILSYLSKTKNKRQLRYKGIRIGFLGLPDFKHYKYQTLANNCSILRKMGYIRQSYGIYYITNKGELFLSKLESKSFKFFETEKTKNDPKDLLIIYDIPQDKTSHRNWFRRELKKFHFIMIQKSAWVGPSPLPTEFSNYVKNIGLSKTIRTFKLAKGFANK